MRDVFDEFYLPDEDEVRTFITEAVLVLDTNVLLELYSLSNSERDRVFELLEKVQDRLWIPYQVGLEYQRNRMSVVRQRGGAYVSARSVHGLSDLEKASERLKDLELPDDVRAAVQSSLEELFAAVEGHVEAFRTAVDELADAHVVSPARALNDDPIREKLDELLVGRVGSPPSDRDGRIREGVRRVGAKTPPGYRDVGKATDEQKAGDYLLWAELLDHAAHPDQSGSRFLFVTLDVKEDWFDRSGGEPIGPRAELLVEFQARNETGYHQLEWQRFLKLANEHLDASVDDDTIARAGDNARDTTSLPETLDSIRATSRLNPDFFRELDAATRSRRDFLDELAAASQPPDFLKELRAASQPPDYLKELREATQPPDYLKELREATQPPDYLKQLRAATQSRRDLLEQLHAATQARSSPDRNGPEVVDGQLESDPED